MAGLAREGGGGKNMAGFRRSMFYDHEIGTLYEGGFGYMIMPINWRGTEEEALEWVKARTEALCLPDDAGFICYNCGGWSATAGCNCAEFETGEGEAWQGYAPGIKEEASPTLNPEQAIEAAIGDYTITDEDRQDPEGMFAFLRDCWVGEDLGFELSHLRDYLARTGEPARTEEGTR